MVEQPIEAWHSKLDSHFTALRRARDVHSPSSPVFALEHGLDLQEELPELESVVRKVVEGSRLPSQAWLPIIVYAAEIGYRYKGDEYWPVFEEETPGWKRRGSSGREYIRRKYELFAGAYGGARPSGVWAAWFRNIAWPITHAVLPADLQKHLARLLSDYRHAFTTELLKDHETLGERLAARSSDTSSRFRKFAEDASLLGMVAASLLLGDEEETPLLSGDVLHRIVVDINRERQAGTWLRNAKRAAVQVRQKGLLGRSLSPREGQWQGITDEQWPKLEVALSLRQMDGAWTAYVKLPSFESIAHRFPSVREEVERLRYRINGVPGVRPRGSMMYRQGPLALKAMPPPNQTPVTVEGASEALSQLLVDHCRIPAKPWLFRIRDPGFAAEVRTNCVRPGQEYILLTQDSPLVSALDGAAAIDITTEGVHGLRFSVPSEVDEAFLKVMRRLDLGLVSEVSVWPAGLVPSSWDSEGRAAWLAGENPILGIRSQRRIAKCVVSTPEDVAEIPWPDEEDKVFVRLTNLEIGTHILNIHFLGVDDPPSVVAQGQFEVRVLDPVDSISSASARQGIQTWAHPSRPTLEELWHGSAVLVVEGPHGEKVQFELQLMTRGGSEILAKHPFSSQLPVRGDRWRELLQAVKGESELKSEFSRAEEMLVVVSNPVLGRTETRAERPFEPLRWSTGYDRDGPFAQLIDHMGSEDLQILRADATMPNEFVQDALTSEGEIRSQDGTLVIASAQDFQTAVVLPPHVSGGIDALRKLKVRPSFQNGNRSAATVLRMIETAHQWTQIAVPADQHAVSLQSQINDAIVAHLSGMIAGSRWLKLEQEIFNDHVFPSQEVLLSALGRSPGERETAQNLLDIAPRIGANFNDRMSVFVESSQLDKDGRLTTAEYAEPILRLSTVPGSLDPNDSLTASMISAVFASPAVLRVARCFVLAFGGFRLGAQGSLLEEWPWE